MRDSGDLQDFAWHTQGVGAVREQPLRDIGADLAKSSGADHRWALQQVRESRFLIDRVDTWIHNKIAPYLGQRVLEVGCGLGNLIRHLSDRELVVGVDIDPEAISHLRQAYAGKSNVQVHQLDICDREVLNLKSLNFDSVVSLNVLEHIENDLLALRHMRSLLCPGGYLTLIVPAHSWLYGTMDRSLGHCRRYNKVLMTERLTKSGFVPVMQGYMNLVGALGWLVSGKILRRYVPPNGQLKIFNLIVPVIRTVEHMVPPPAGVSLVTIARGF